MIAINSHHIVKRQIVAIGPLTACDDSTYRHTFNVLLAGGHTLTFEGAQHDVRAQRDTLIGEMNKHGAA